MTQPTPDADLPPADDNDPLAAERPDADLTNGRYAVPEIPNAWGLGATLGYSAICLVVFIAVQVVALAVVMVVGMANTGVPNLNGHAVSQNVGLLTSTSVISAVVVSLPFLVFITSTRAKPVSEYLGLKRPRLLQTVVHVAVYLAFLLALDTGKSWLDWNVVPPFMTDVVRTAGSLPLLILAVVVAAPVFEELFFRGFMFRGIADSSLGTLAAIAITATVFAAIHVQYDIIGIAEVFLMGLWLAGVRAMTGSTTLTILLHAAGNLLAVVQTIKAVGTVTLT